MNVQPLLDCLADGEFHSGQALGKRLSISRTAVWKQIQVLRNLGVDVHATTGLGYRVAGGLDLLDKQRITDGLRGGAQVLANHFDLHFSIDSTNTQAMAKVEAGESHYLIMAEHQWQGRGRRGRTWVSPFGHNLYMSLVWGFQGGVAALEGLSLVCGLSVVRALNSVGLDGFHLKWPNDVLYQGRKLAGILLEVSGDVTGPCRVVIGIGMNTRMPAASGRKIDQPFSDLAAAGGRVERNTLASALISELFMCLVEFEQHGFAGFQSEWMALDHYQGCPVEIRAGSHAQQGVARGVDVQGRLLLETAEELITVAGGELMPSLRPLPTGDS